MKAVLYETLVCDGAMDFAHGCYQRIWEIWIPEVGIYVNTAHDHLNVFTPEEGDKKKPRIPADRKEGEEPLVKKDIDFPDKLALDLKKFMSSRDRLMEKTDKELEKYFPE